MQKVAILYDASQAVLSTFDLDEVLNQILAIARDYFRLQSGAILLLDNETAQLRVRAHFGGEDDKQPWVVKTGEGITGTAAKLKRPVCVPDVTKDPRYICGASNTRSELAVPLMLRDEVVGVLDCQSDEPNHFDSEMVDLLTLFSTQASIGLQNAHLYSLEQQRARQLEAINAVARGGGFWVTSCDGRSAGLTPCCILETDARTQYSCAVCEGDWPANRRGARGQGHQHG